MKKHHDTLYRLTGVLHMYPLDLSGTACQSTHSPVDGSIFSHKAGHRSTPGIPQLAFCTKITPSFRRTTAGSIFQFRVLAFGFQVVFWVSELYEIGFKVFDELLFFWILVFVFLGHGSFYNRT
jgi:hypothetical protein